MQTAQNKIHEITRRSIVDMLLLRETPFHGRLDYMEFLKRVWPLDQMPSWDNRFRIATHDIGTHMRFGDWTDSYLLLERLNLATGPDEEFVRFLEAVVHPLAIPDEEAIRDVVSDINQHLRGSGFQVVEKTRISGKPIFEVIPLGFVATSPQRTSWEKVDRQASAMRDQLARAGTEEEYQIVGHLGRELMISLAQAVISPEDAAGQDGKVPSNTDASRLLDTYIGNALPGGSNEDLRRAVRAVAKATSAVLHDRNATQKDAALVAELVFASVRFVHKIAEVSC